MSKKILVVDDESHMVRLVQFNIEKAGYCVITASNGREALEILEKENVDLIIVDMMMPEIDGLELCKHLKEHPKWKTYPVIMLTAKAQLTDKLSSKEVGVKTYITKPFNIKELVTAIEETLKDQV